jgi:putative membrane protein
VFASIGTAAPAFHGGVACLPLFIVGHVFWFVIVILIIAFAIGGRRRRRARWGAFGRGGFGPWGTAAHGAESTLAERFAQGDIDEKEYRARLEVLRANSGVQNPAAK